MCVRLYPITILNNEKLSIQTVLIFARGQVSIPSHGAALASLIPAREIYERVDFDLAITVGHIQTAVILFVASLT